MERELWPPLYRLKRELGAAFCQKNVTFQPWVIALVWLWAALHDRHPRWACEPAHWRTTRLRPLRLPCLSTISRRLYKPALAWFFTELERRLRQTEEVGLLVLLDGKPLPVSNVSKDPDARRGRGDATFCKGGHKSLCVWIRTAFAGGLGPLAAWVRRQRRVRMWTWAKLLINGIRIHRKRLAA
jgi:hypothetical protein